MSNVDAIRLKKPTVNHRTVSETPSHPTN